jgi:type I restriction enzyme, S subunit
MTGAETPRTWYGELPDHWAAQPLKALFRVVGGSTPKSDREDYWDGDIIWVTPSDLKDDTIAALRGSQRTITELGVASCGTTLVPPSSIVLSTRAPIGSLGIAEVPLCTNQGCKSLVPRPTTSSAFYAYLLSVTTTELRLRGKGTTFLELSSDELGAFRVPVPPLSEQTSIAAFLDRETSEIDALVAEQRRLIELLMEERQAIVSHTVTRGLNPDAKLKPSGIAWLEDLPAHWSMSRGRWLFRKLDLAPLETDGVVTAFRDGQVTLRQRRRTEGYTFAELEVGYQHVREGDLVINGMDAFAGAIGVSEATGKCTPEYSVLEPRNENVNTGYFALVLRLMALRNYVYVICPSVRERAPRFRFEKFKDVVLPVPPIAEQRAIVEAVAAKIDETNRIIIEAEALISLLIERRSALISAAVTGKIDVREASAEQEDAA